MLKATDEPSWLANESTADSVDWEDQNSSTQKQIADTGSAYEEAKKSFKAAISPGDEEEFKTMAVRGFTIVHIAAATLMYTSAVVAFARDPGFGEFFLAAYTSLFATILAAFELAGAYDMEQIDEIFRENLGFLYHPTYKGIYLIFIAFVNLGLSSNSPALEYFTTLFVLCDGCALVYFSFQNPEWFPIDDFEERGHRPLPTEVI